MALENIRSAILIEAQKIADEQKKEGDKKIEIIKKEWQEKIEEKKREIILSAKRKINQKIQQAQFNIQSETQSLILKEKQKIIDRVFESSLKKISNFEESKIESLLIKLISQIPYNEGRLIPVSGWENKLKKALLKTNKKYEISNKTIKGLGGFIFESKNIEIDQTFEALIKNSKERISLDVIKTVFGN